MQKTMNIEYYIAQNFFEEAERSGKKLILGNMNTNFWLHKEKINLDNVIEVAKNFADSRIFIISEGNHQGFYIYSKLKKACIKLITSTSKIPQVEIA